MIVYIRLLFEKYKLDGLEYFKKRFLQLSRIFHRCSNAQEYREVEIIILNY